MDRLPRVTQLEQVAREQAAGRAAAREREEEERRRDETRQAARAARVAAFECSDESDDNQDGPQLHSVARQRQGRRRTTANAKPKFSGFLTVSKTSIRSTSLATALVGVLQIADGHADGIVGALGHGKRSKWMQDNVNMFFQPDGPLSNYKAPALRRFTGFLWKPKNLHATSMIEIIPMMLQVLVTRVCLIGPGCSFVSLTPNRINDLPTDKL